MTAGLDRPVTAGEQDAVAVLQQPVGERDRRGDRCLEGRLGAVAGGIGDEVHGRVLQIGGVVLVDQQFAQAGALFPVDLAHGVPGTELAQHTGRDAGHRRVVHGGAVTVVGAGRQRAWDLLGQSVERAGQDQEVTSGVHPDPADDQAQRVRQDEPGDTGPLHTTLPGAEGHPGLDRGACDRGVLPDGAVTEEPQHLGVQRERQALDDRRGAGDAATDRRGGVRHVDLGAHPRQRRYHQHEQQGEQQHHRGKHHEVAQVLEFEDAPQHHENHGAEEEPPATPGECDRQGLSLRPHRSPVSAARSRRRSGRRQSPPWSGRRRPWRSVPASTGGAAAPWPPGGRHRRG